MRALGHHEQFVLSCLWSFDEQVGLHESRHVGIERHSTLLVPLANHPDPAPCDVDIANGEAEHFGAAQPRKEHQSGHGPVPIRAQTGEQILNLLTLQTPGESSRLTDPQLRTRTWSSEVTEHARALALGRCVGPWRRAALD